MKNTYQRYLALDAILPGDVILSSARTLRSVLIRLGTGSFRASHAAIAIHPLIWFESVGSGVRYQIIEAQLVWDGERIRLAMLIPSGERYLIRRPVQPFCTAEHAADRYSTSRQLIDVTSRFAFLNYARPSAFLATIRLGLGDSAFSRFLSAAMDRRHRIFYPGPFCSWLVAECYRDLGKDLFGDRPHAVTPAALSRSSRLVSLDADLRGAARIDTTTRTRSFERDLQVALELASQHLTTISSGAVLAKGITQMNEYIRGVVRRGWHIRGAALPRQIEDTFRGIEDKQLATFGKWQTQVKNALDLAYPSICVHTDQIGRLRECYARCSMSEPNGGRCHPDSCHFVTQGFLQTLEALYTVFPRPPELLQ